MHGSEVLRRLIFTCWLYWTATCWRCVFFHRTWSKHPSAKIRSSITLKSSKPWVNQNLIPRSAGLWLTVVCPRNFIIDKAAAWSHRAVPVGTLAKRYLSEWSLYDRGLTARRGKIWHFERCNCWSNNSQHNTIAFCFSLCHTQRSKRKSLLLTIAEWWDTLGTLLELAIWEW